MNLHFARTWEHIQQARWYAGKGRQGRLVSVMELPWWLAPGPDRLGVRSDIAEIHFADGGPAQWYHLIWALSDDGAIAFDATDDPTTSRALWNALRSKDSSDPSLQVWRHVDLPASLEPRRFGGEQSNTSVLYGTESLLKIFRRLEIGSNVDVEVHRLLTQAQSDETAQLQASATAHWPSAQGGPHDGEHQADLLMVVSQISQATDGWDLALEFAESGRSFVAEAELLGAALGRVHHRLADGFGRSTTSGNLLAQRLLADYDRSVAQLAALEEFRGPIHAAAAGLNNRELPTMRIHGDCHLGQALRAADNWIFVDFEGEPAKPLAERRRPDSGWRDVAGVLRSISYAAATALRRNPELDRVALDQWRDQASHGVVTGYTRTAPYTADSDVLLAYLIDRAVYEVVYELGHRPDWVSIPLADLRTILADAATVHRQDTVTTGEPS